MDTNPTFKMRSKNIEGEVLRLQKDTQEGANNVSLGSDEHLDILLSVIKQINLFSEATETVADILYEKLSSISDQVIIDKILPALENLNIACMSYIYAMENSPHADNIKTALDNYKEKYGYLKEIIGDLKIRLTKDDNISSLLEEINHTPI